MSIAELVRERVSIIVTRAFDAYGYFNTEEEKRQFFETSVEILLIVNDRIERDDVISIVPVKERLLASLFVFGFDKTVIEKVFDLVAKSVFAEIESQGFVDPDTVRVYQRYADLLAEAINDLDSLIRTDIVEYVGGLEEYGRSELRVDLGRTGSRLIKENRAPVTDGFRSRLGTRRFETVYNRKVSEYAQIVSASAEDINAITSDSRVNFDVPESVDTDLLSDTFAGGGKSIYADVVRLFNSAAAFGGYQGSVSGSAEYLASYSEYLMAMSYGKRLPAGLLGGDFGRFDRIYGDKSLPERVAGLKFLEPLYQTRSGSQSVSEVYPVAERYGNGVTDRYESPERRPGTNFGSLILESVYIECLKVGDTIQSLINRPLPGIGDTTYVLSVLQNVFPPSLDGLGRDKGVTGGVYKLLVSYRKLFALFGTEPDLSGIQGPLTSLSSVLSDFAQTVKGIGFKAGSPVPSLSLTYHEPSRVRIRENLERLGFNGPEIDLIMSAKTFTELVESFAPVTDSQDIISFFRAYELTKLLYEFGGQESIDAYTDFLYGVDDPTRSLIRMLGFLDRGRSSASKVVGSQYSKLIGYVITLTYAVNPAELSRLNQILVRNNLNLFESISLLVQQGTDTVIKGKGDVDMLGAVAAQMVTSDMSGYESQKPLWNRLISESAGNAARRDLNGLYLTADGIVPEELNSLLNRPSSTSPLGQLMDGVRGGNLTSLLRYCNLFGLLYSLSPYRNSGQLVNNDVKDYGLMVELIATVEKLSERMKFSAILLESDLGAPAGGDVPLLAVQNKTFSAFTALVAGQIDGLGNSAIAESPGIGNSRIANGLRIDNSLTPEESAIIAPQAASLGLFSERAGREESSSYIRFAVSNLLSSVRMSESELRSLGGEVSLPTPTTSDPQPQRAGDFTDTYSPAVPVDPALPLTSPTTFDPIASCRRFGGTNCTEIGYDPGSLCEKPFSKALFAEQGYGQQSDDPSVSVDRPLGSRISRSRTFNRTGTSDPEYLFGRFGLTESTRRQGVMKDSEMLCASLTDPFEYGACMSLLKCKKFKPPYAGKYSLPFCPTTLHGGRIRI